MNPTTEQLQAVEQASLHNRLKISAGAGCTKTTTLSLIANANPVPSLYLAYNKAMAEEARSKFPNWVTVKTTHALAYAVFGRQMNHKLSRPRGRYENVCGTGGEIAKYFGIEDFYLNEHDKITAAGMGLAVKETVNRFEYSADAKIKGCHISYTPVENRKLEEKIQSYNTIVLETAKQLWALRTNLKSPILATHDTYLKLYQLSKPTLSAYDIVYLDEAQDTNDCVLSIIGGLTEPKVIIVGDKYQQIYGWRGSVNAMEKLDYAETRLTQSFRYGQAIADVANDIIGEGFDLKGWDQLDTVAMHREEFEGEGEHTILYRTNACLLMDAVYFISKGLKVNLEIDVKDFLRQLESAVELYRGNLAKVKHESLLQFDSWAALQDEADIVKGELQRVMNMVESGDVFRIIGILSTQQNTTSPDIIMTTAHKSKGREWDVVLLADDFPSNYNNKGEWVGLNEMERNLLYVACTRAKKVLAYNNTVQEIRDRVAYSVDEFIRQEVKALCVEVREIVQIDNRVGLHQYQKRSEKELLAKLAEDEHFDTHLEETLAEAEFETPTPLLMFPAIDACGNLFGLSSSLDEMVDAQYMHQHE